MQVRGKKKLKKNITNANAKTMNQKITKIKIKNVKNPSQKKKNCKNNNNNNKTKLLSKQTTQTSKMKLVRKMK
jgi:hypothetical protein